MKVVKDLDAAMESYARLFREDPRDESTWETLGRLTRVLESDMVLTIEPGIYIIDMLLDRLRATPAEQRVDWAAVERFAPYGGIRIEDNVRVLDDGVENFTREAFAL